MISFKKFNCRYSRQAGRGLAEVCPFILRYDSHQYKALLIQLILNML
jgi:hypothetical protein